MGAEAHFRGWVGFPLEGLAIVMVRVISLRGVVC